jgi:DNA (cytosine-5)-methyltransferase 1
MKYLSLCSGIEAASVAWRPLGWEPLAFAEIESFPSAVLSERHPDVPNLGDMTKVDPDGLRPDVVVAGTPCQSFSVAGLRKGLADPRGNLAFDLLRIVDRARPEWLVWENVPGVLSSWTDEATFAPSEESRRLLEADGLDARDFVEVEQTNDFDQFTSAIRELGYGLAWGSLDAQYFGLAQRRERVFVVAHLGDWTRAAAVLFDRESLSGNPAPSREAGAGTSRNVAASIRSGGAGTSRVGDTRGQDNVVAANNFGERDTATALSTKNQRLDADTETFVVHSFDWQAGGSHPTRPPTMNIVEDGTGALSATPAIAFAQNQRDEIRTMDVVGALPAEPGMKQQSYVAIPIQEIGRRCGKDRPQNGIGIGEANDPMFTLQAGAQHGVGTGMAVRRLTPAECEALQGFPRNYTNITYRGKPAADGPRYRALGNSMAVPVMRWIGERIAQVAKARAVA